jgi:hypothetical protein
MSHVGQIHTAREIKSKLLQLSLHVKSNRWQPALRVGCGSRRTLLDSERRESTPCTDGF